MCFGLWTNDGAQLRNIFCDSEKFKQKASTISIYYFLIKIQLVYLKISHSQALSYISDNKFIILYIYDTSSGADFTEEKLSGNGN